MARYALKIEYDGGPFKGWQIQAGLPTVQGEINAALRKLEPDCAGVQGAGRTDTGVHATGQVAHVDLIKDWPPERLQAALNYHLKTWPVAVVACARVAPDFHARFSALERQYTFRLLSRSAPLTFERGNMWVIRHQLALGPMREAAAHLLGRHDFTTFRSSLCQAKSPVKTLDELRIEQHPFRGGVETRFFLRARSFLHNQVRSFVGTLERVGAGAWEPGQVKAALQAKDRAACGPVCPPWGLYLSAVRYEGAVFDGADAPRP